MPMKYLCITMKNILYILFASFTLTVKICNAQCRDIYGHKVECPTMDDSLVVYNNALKVYEYYENNPSYSKTRSQELMTKDEKRRVYELLEQARRMFYIIRREIAKLTAEEKKYNKETKPKQEYKDVTFKEYYSEIDEFKFYQRELENQIVNLNAPASLYDNRIAPILINEYRNIDSNDIYFGDLVNLPLYIPVVVKPYLLLTSAELKVRNEILHILPSIEPPKEPKVIRHMVKRDSIKLDTFNISNGSPIYAFNEYGSGALIGFLINRKFKKIEPKDYDEYAVPSFARKLLMDDKALDKMLRIKFGSYYLGLHN